MAQADALVIHSGASNEVLAQAAQRLASGRGAVLLDDVLTLRRTSRELRCEVLDRSPDVHRCAQEYEVMIENARRALERSPLYALLPQLPQAWCVVEVHGTGSNVVWPASNS